MSYRAFKLKKKERAVRGELLLKALELVEQTLYTIPDFIEAFLSSSKGNYYALRNFSPKAYNTLAEAIREDLKERKRISNLLYKLRHDGLIKKIEKNGKKVLVTTHLGLLRKEKLSNRPELQLPRKRYKANKGKELIIISFDIPELERKKRDWLRAIISRFGFEMLHKSVWLGKITLPQDFIDDLRRLKLLDFVEIFAVTKKGSLRQIL